MDTEINNMKKGAGMMSTTKRQVHLNVFLRGAGHHAAAWRHPDTHPELGFDFRYYLKLAQIAERGLLDSLFMADGYVGTGRRLEPFTLLSALASVTEHIGLIGTVGTTYNEPYHVARKFASLDHISGGGPDGILLPDIRMRLHTTSAGRSIWSIPSVTRLRRNLSK